MCGQQNRRGRGWPCGHPCSHAPAQLTLPCMCRAMQYLQCTRRGVFWPACALLTFLLNSSSGPGSSGETSSSQYRNRKWVTVRDSYVCRRRRGKKCLNTQHNKVTVKEELAYNRCFHCSKPTTQRTNGTNGNAWLLANTSVVTVFAVCIVGFHFSAATALLGGWGYCCLIMVGSAISNVYA